ncbi:putative protein kinase UbiB [Candidatus Hepatincola sp. Av]
MIVLRLCHITYLFIRYNCFFLLYSSLKLSTSKTRSTRLVKFLEYGGPIFIKLGQVLSTRVDMFNDVFLEELQKLRDQAKPINSVIIDNILFQELHLKVQDVFQEIEETPVASASIAQIHKGVLKNGKTVALKIIKPNTARIFKQDIAILKILFWLIEVLTKRGRISKPTRIIDYLEKSIKMELDLSYEAAAIDEFRDNFKEDPDVYVPKVYWSYVSKNILVEEWIDGFKITDISQIQNNNLSLESITKKITKVFFVQTLQYGFFHGDIHPGNVFVLKTGQIALVDFGIMGRLDEKNQDYLTNLFIAFLNKDYYKAAKIHFDAGWISNKYTIEDFSLACRSIVEKILYLPQEEIMLGDLLHQLFVISGDFAMEIQENLLLLQKNLLYLEHIGRKLSPKNNMWIVSKSIIEENISNRYGLEYYIKKLYMEPLNEFKLLKESLFTYNCSLVKLLHKQSLYMKINLMLMFFVLCLMCIFIIGSY